MEEKLSSRSVRTQVHGRDPTELTAAAYDLTERIWNDAEMRLAAVPGKDALSAVNRYLQDKFGVSVTATSIVEAMHVDEVFDEMRGLIDMLENFARSHPQG